VYVPDWSTDPALAAATSARMATVVRIIFDACVYIALFLSKKEMLSTDKPRLRAMIKNYF
jgi:hypothetical protein